MTLIDRIIAQVVLVAEYWPSIAQLLDPTLITPRPASLLTADQRAELDYQAWWERWERIDLAPGEHTDAARVEIIDLTTSLVIDADTLVEIVSSGLASPWVRPDLPSTASSDPWPLLAFVVRHLGDIDRNRQGDVLSGLSDMVEAMSRALCLAHDGQILTAVCPWCKGGLYGGRSLRVRVLPGDLVAIVCESDIPCTPSARKVGTWIKGRPAWPFAQWPWLAQQLHKASVRERVAG